MIVYTVHEKPNGPADRIERAERLVFVRDGFTWSAAIFGPFWMLAKGLWLVALLYIAASVGLGYGLRWLGVAPGWLTLGSLAVNILLGFEAGSLQRWTLRRRGWQMVGSVTGRTWEECERRFFDGWLPHEPLIRPSSESVRAAAATQLIGGPATRLADGVRG